jgi:uncharacterized membrane protein YtjA (UPF0391 family)
VIYTALALFVLSIVAAVFGFGINFAYGEEFRITFFFLIGAFVLTLILGLLWKRPPPSPL